MNYTATIRDPPTPQPELFSLYEELGGARPDRLSEVRPQDRDLRHTVDQIVDAVPGLPALDVPVPQMVDRPLVLLAAFDVLVPKQVIEVPKMSTPTRTVLSVPQTAEQLVEAPNVVSLIDVIRHPVEQTVGGGRIGGLRGFLQDRVIPFLRSRSLTIQFLVSVVVLVEVFMVYTQDRVLQRFMELIIVFLQRLPSRTLTFQLRVVTIFIKILFLQPVLQICWKRQIKRFFALFPVEKKCEDPAHPWVRTGRGLQLMASVCLAGGSPVGSGTDGSTWQTQCWRVRFLSGPPSFRRSWQPR